MDEARLHVSQRLKSLMAYPKMAGERPRILILESQYWLDGACLRAAERLGWETASVPTRMEGVLPRALVSQLIETLAAFRPDFILSINLSGMDEAGLFAHLFADLEIPYVTWFVDDPRTIMLDRNVYGSAYSVALTWERAYAPYLEERGFGGVYWLPLAVDPERFDADAAAEAEGPPAFVGNSMTEPAAHERAWLTAHPVLESLLRAAFEEGRVTRENFGRGLGAILGEENVVALDEHQRRHAEIYCFAEGTRLLRAETVSVLAPHGLRVYGDTHWENLTPNAGPYLDYAQGLAGFYRDCAVNLNITSIQMAAAVNQRVFDCPAAGGFLLTDAQADLEGLFGIGEEVITYENLEDAAEKLSFYREHPEARRDVVRRARKRIFAEHTYVHRLERIAGIIREHYGE